MTSSPQQRVFPKRALFAFNTNLDYVKKANLRELSPLEEISPRLYSLAAECFENGVQKEVSIGGEECWLLLAKMRFDRKTVGGQAGNAAQQAAALGVECFVHANFFNRELYSAFEYPERILVATRSGFAKAALAPPQGKCAHHFVFENSTSDARLIASFDPAPLHPNPLFCRSIMPLLAGINKAFVGGLNLLKTPAELKRFAKEIGKWKKTNPSLEVFVELGTFSDSRVLAEVKKQVFPLADAVGLNESELALLETTPDELLEHVPSVLFHTPRKSLALPKSAENKAALEFAEKCASFRARYGSCANARQAQDAKAGLVRRPLHAVGLGDTLSSAFFIARKPFRQKARYESALRRTTKSRGKGIP